MELLLLSSRDVQAEVQAVERAMHPNGLEQVKADLLLDSRLPPPAEQPNYCFEAEACSVEIVEDLRHQANGMPNAQIEVKARKPNHRSLTEVVYQHSLESTGHATALQKHVDMVGLVEQRSRKPLARKMPIARLSQALRLRVADARAEKISHPR